MYESKLNNYVTTLKECNITRDYNSIQIYTQQKLILLQSNSNTVHQILNSTANDHKQYCVHATDRRLYLSVCRVFLNFRLFLMADNLSYAAWISTNLAWASSFPSLCLEKNNFLQYLKWVYKQENQLLHAITLIRIL